MIFNIRHTHRADRSTKEEKEKVKKFYDTPISEIGRYQAFHIGIKLGEVAGRDKKFCFIVSPHLRCMQTAELILCGLDISHHNLYENKLFVEDAIRETQLPDNVESLDNFHSLHIHEQAKLISFPYEINTFEPLKEYWNKDNFPWPEYKEHYAKRAFHSE